jgi:hypothetical protein
MLHREHAERAAGASAHVLCEKPMANTEEDCEAMMRAAEKNNVKLMIAYRLHFNDANLHAVEVAQCLHRRHCPTLKHFEPACDASMCADVTGPCSVPPSRVAPPTAR